MNIKHFVAAACVALPLGLAGTAQANDAAGISRDLQAQILQQCKDELRVPGIVRLQSLTATSPLFVANGNGNRLSLRQARNINKCAKNSYAAFRASGTTMVASHAQTDPAHQSGAITNQDYGAKIGYSASSQSTHRWEVPGCPPGFNGMYRGTLYCINGRPID